jgi:beta-N-acetylhexosaminidase
MLVIAMLAGCGKTPLPNASPTASPTASISPAPTQAPSTATVSPSASPSVSPSVAPSANPVDEIERRLQAMTLEQKVGQLIMAGVDGTAPDASAKRMLAEDHVGGVILFKDNISDAHQATAMINGLKAANSAGNSVPLFVSVDQEGGRVNRLPASFVAMPSNQTVGRTDNPALAGQMGALIAKELRLLGFNIDNAPVLDVFSNPKNTVIGDRSFGSAADLVVRMGTAEMKGIQKGGIIPVVKHFPGHGDTSVDSHLELPIVYKTEADLLKLEWIPFRAAADEGADAVMVAHILYPKLDPDAPASLSKTMIQGMLRDRLGFGGVVFTDDLTMGAIIKHYGIADAAVRAIEAGADIALVAHGYDNEHLVYKALLSAAKSGRIPQSRVDESVRRILKLKTKYALSDSAIPLPRAADLPNNAVRDWLKSVEASG